MTQGVEPNDIFHNGVWYNRAGGGGVVTSEVDPVTGGISYSGGEVALRMNSDGVITSPVNNVSGRIGFDLEQPLEIASPVQTYGKLACRFGSGQWSISGGSPTLTQGYTGWDGAGNKTGITSRTGQPDMLKVVPAANTTEEILLGSFGTNMLTPTLGGAFGLWVYVDGLPNFAPTQTPNSTISVMVSTNGASSTNALNVSFNANQVREGWNFLKFVQRNPSAYQSGSGQTEYHPFGVVCTGFGTGVDADIITNPAARFRVSWTNMLGATLYFDSVWTAFSSKAQLVLGCDGGANLTQIAAPLFDEYGWVGYAALPFNTVDSGTSNNTVQVNLSNTLESTARVVYEKGWDVINHSVTHPSLGLYTSEAAIAYQVRQAKAWLTELGYIRGSDFYASPQSSTSRLAQKVISVSGFKLQRHSIKSNVSVTPDGIDNPASVGSIDMGNTSSLGVASITSGTAGSVNGFQTATKIKRYFDVIVAYGDTGFPFWHGITSVGDTGTGEDLTGDNLLLTKSAFELSMAYARQLEQAGSLRVCRGVSGFWYGN